MIGYKYFTSTKDFEWWQINNPDKQIHQVLPQILGLQLEGEQEDEMFDAGADTIMGIFVTFLYEVKNEG